MGLDASPVAEYLHGRGGVCVCDLVGVDPDVGRPSGETGFE